jgi:hypothetical protein
MGNRETLKKMKIEADELGVKYASNITAKTLKKRIEEFKADNEAQEEVETLTETIESKSREEVETPTKAVGKRYCKGLFVWLPETEFTNSQYYSDRYLAKKKLI